MSLLVPAFVVACAIVVGYLMFFRKPAGTRVARIADLPRGQMREVTVEKNKVLLVHTKAGKLHAVGAKCTHYNAPLAKGTLCGDRVVCPWHGACFNVSTGDIEDGCALDKLPTFRCHVGSDGFIYVQAPKNRVPTKVQPPMSSGPAPTAGDVDLPRVVIVGGGPAGATAAETLRQEGFTGFITIISKENCLPYDRIKLSKSMTVAAEEIQLRSRDFYEKARIELELGVTVNRIDSETNTVHTDNGDFRYTQLLVATGGAARSFKAGERFVTPGADLRNIFVLREAADSAGIVGALSNVGDAANITIVGSSFIGMEAAAYLAKNHKGSTITVVGMETVPFERVLGVRLGEFFQRWHAEFGVQFRMEAKVKAFLGDGAINGVELESGEIIPTDVVVIGAGIIPSTQFLRDTAGVELFRDGGVIVDEFLQAADNIWAAGDIARFPFHHATHESSANIRVEHWAVALEQGRIAARNMLGQQQPHRTVPFFWTAMYGRALRYAGNAMTFDHQIIHGSMDSASTSKFTVYFVNGDAVAAVATFNRDPQAVAALELLRLQRMPTRAILEASADFDLVAFLAEQTAA